MADDVQERNAPDLDGGDADAVTGGAVPGDGLGERLDAMPAGAALLAELEGLDLGALPSYELPEVVVQARRIAAHAHALETAAAATLARHPDLRHPDLAAVCRSLPEGTAFVHADIAAADLSARLLVPPAEAKMLIREGRAYADALADTGVALADGRIDPAKARAIVQGAGDEPAHVAAAVEAEVLPRVAGRSVKQVRADVARALNRVDPDGVADRHRAARDCRVVSRPRILQDGMAGLWAVLPAAEAVRVDGMLDALARRSREAGDARTLDQLRADELVDRLLGRSQHVVAPDGTVLPSQRGWAYEDLDACGAPAGAAGAAALTGVAPLDGEEREGDAREGEPTETAPAEAAPVAAAPAHPGHVCPSGPRTVVHVTLALSTLMGADDEPGELAGYGPIDAQQARAMALDLGSTWQRIVTDPLSGTVLDVGRTTYRPPAALADHVRHRDKYCTAPGCPVPAARCDLDHTVEYHPPADGSPPRPLGSTCAHNLGPLCRTHHRLKTAGILRVCQPTAGEFLWRTPTGHAFRVRPGTEEPTIHLTGRPHPPAQPPY
ncbi:HNH endonuclease signature motif containing protein [Cellulomonas sp. PS-H5]|uniref:HNH endonuclease signature motif containing protein n=1 Tax=Cellulomonas sp. PS-H5 TaxID=2820400 RepID=UPI001C4F688B|nr:HNH endonuclease signature motif containing protein [Cellulomonas sp. PS-H5]MBW0252749.1 HNH endonuclease [Cellulomonas sp. PS-H5]